MVAKQLMVPALAALMLVFCGKSDPEAAFREALAKQTVGILRLPAGDLVLKEPLRVTQGSRDLEIRGGNASRLVAGPNFKGGALLIIEKSTNVLLSDFAVDGNRGTLAKPFEMAPPENAFRVWYKLNGVLADQVEGLHVERVQFANVVGFPLLVSRSTAVRIDDVDVTDSGGLNAKGRNNLSGGILLEEGTADFQVQRSRFRNIRGNALWTHSLFTSPQLLDGVFQDNQFERVGRDAILVGHAKRVTVEGNRGRDIGYPQDIVDVENGGVPVAIDTAGDVEGAVYARNQFDEINGKCMDLDGFHDGVVEANICTDRKPGVSYPSGHFGIVLNNTHPAAHSNNIIITGNIVRGAKYGGLYLMGENNQVTNNRFENVNTSGCNEHREECVYRQDEPNMLGSGIYLGRGVARLENTHGNVIRNNFVSGPRMNTQCIVMGPGVERAANTIENNECREQSAE